MKAAFLRFLVAGLATTATSYAIYLALLPLLHYQLAYAVGYFAGMLLQWQLHARYVYGVRSSLRVASGYPLIHALLYGAGAAVLALCVERMGLARPIALAVVIAVNIPLGFALTYAWNHRMGTPR